MVPIDRHGSFRQILKLGLDAIKHAIKDLGHFGKQFLVIHARHRRYVRGRLTPAGQELLHIARRVLGDFDSALSEFGNFMKGFRGQVSVAALPSMNVALLPSAIANFRQKHPEVEFKLQELAAEALLVAVDEGRADFGICAKPAPDQRLRFRLLMDDPMVLVCRNGDPIAGGSDARWSVFAERPYIGIQSGSSIRQIIDSVFVRKKLAVRAAFEAPSVAACCALVREGLGIAALPRLSLGLADVRDLVAVPLIQPSASRSVGIVTRIGRTLSPASLAFMATLGQHT